MRNEYPRPDFVREQWLSLNGRWSFRYGKKETSIEVPFVCQSKLSGIGETITEDTVQYARSFRVPEMWKNREILLHFGAVDYRCRVFVNGHLVGAHVGGQTPFTLNVTPFLTWSEEELRVEVEDPLRDETIARGKQNWEGVPRFIWYTPSTGIWQSVWLEPVEKTHIEWVHFTPDIDEGTVRIDCALSDQAQLPVRLCIRITREGEAVFEGTLLCNDRRSSLTVDVFRKKAMEGSFHFTGSYWTPENPVLYDVELTLENTESGEVLDKASAYFGMRKIHVENGRLYLNNQPYLHKLLLDQGYWEESLITAPSDEEYRNDILKSKAMGFNGCRKHEKVEDPRFLYWADHLGFLVWEGMASFWSYTPDAAAAFSREWLDVIHRDYNHPCIVVWGMLNESWGVPRIYSNKQQQDFARSLYYLAKGQDTTRLVISNDGWEMVESDICAIHSYKHGEKGDLRQHELFARSLQDPDQFCAITEKIPYVKGECYRGQPTVLTECGGIAIRSETIQDICQEDAIRTSELDWGYTSSRAEDFLAEYQRIIDAVYDSDLMNGFCYTQLTDVEQEQNGLLTRSHAFKFDPAEIKKINDRKK